MKLKFKVRINFLLCLMLSLLVTGNIIGQESASKNLPTLSEIANSNTTSKHVIDLKPFLKDQRVIYDDGDATIVKSRNDTAIFLSVNKIELNLFEVKFRYENIDHLRGKVFASVVSNSDYTTADMSHQVVGLQIHRYNDYQYGQFYFAGPYPTDVGRTPILWIFIDGFIFRYSWVSTD